METNIKKGRLAVPGSHCARNGGLYRLVRSSPHPKRDNGPDTGSRWQRQNARGIMKEYNKAFGLSDPIPWYSTAGTIAKSFLMRLVRLARLGRWSLTKVSHQTLPPFLARSLDLPHRSNQLLRCRGLIANLNAIPGLWPMGSTHRWGVLQSTSLTDFVRKTDSRLLAPTNTGSSQKRVWI